MPGPTILVTGAGGFIGQAVGHSLDAAGSDWRPADRSNGAELTDPTALATLPATQVVVHLAGGGSVPTSWTNPLDIYRNNIASTLTVLEHARRNGAHVVLASSYMYGIPHYLPVDEEHPVACNNPYARSKRLCEDLASGFALDFSIPVTILRIFNPYGPGQAPEFLIPTIIRQALRSDSIIVDDLAPKRDYLWIGDLADAIWRVAISPAAGLRIFNIGSGSSHSVADVIGAVTAITGPRQIVCRNRERENEIPDCICSNRKFSGTFNWQPATVFADGIRMTVEALIDPINPGA